MTDRSTNRNAPSAMKKQKLTARSPMPPPFTLIGVSVRDTAQLLGLETRLVIKTVFMMVVLGLVLGLVILGVWLSITVIVAAGLYEFTPWA